MLRQIRRIAARATKPLRPNPARVAALVDATKDPDLAELHVALWHEFVKPPYGGGNQFFLALKAAMLGMGARVSENRFPRAATHLMNATWFEVDRFRKHVGRTTNGVVHRIDGITSSYRGERNSIDDQAFALNKEFADATVLQSEWSAKEIGRHGFDPMNPVVIPNAVDPRIFHPEGRIGPPQDGEKLKVLAMSWSDNPLKGGEVLEWLDANLDHERYAVTFLGRTQKRFKNFQTINALPSEGVAHLLRAHHVYIAPSRLETCSNALLEALSCGLPAIYRNEGGHPELVKGAGIPFDQAEQVPEALERTRDHYERYQSRIDVRSLQDVAHDYVRVLRSVRG